MHGEASVNEKSTKIVFREAWPRSRPAVNTATTPPVSVTPPMTTTPPMLPSMLPYPYSYLMPTYIPTHLPYNYTMPTAESPTNLNPALLALGTIDLRQRSPLPSAAPSPQAGPVPSLPAAGDIPDVIDWFAYLDKHEQWNCDGVTYEQFGPILKSHGFVRISQLISEFLPVPELQKLLNVKLGTVVQILDYIREDLHAIRSGKLVFPKGL